LYFFLRLPFRATRSRHFQNVSESACAWQRDLFDFHNQKTNVRTRRSRLQNPTRRENVRRRHLPSAPANENNRLARPITNVIALLALSVLINYIDAQPLHRCIVAERRAGLSPPSSHSVVLLFWTYCLFLPVPAAGRPLDVNGDGSGLFLWSATASRACTPSRHCSPRASCWDRRIRRLSVQREDPGPVCSGSWAWIRKRTHRCRSWMRPALGRFSRHAHGAIRMAPLLHRAWVVSMAWLIPVRMDARRDGRFARGAKQRRISKS